MAKRRLCLGSAGVISCTPLSTLSFSVSLFPGMCGYNNRGEWEVALELKEEMGDGTWGLGKRVGGNQGTL